MSETSKSALDARLSVCQLSLPDTTFEEDLQVIKGSGAPGVALAEFKMRDGEDDKHIADLRASGLTATVCIPANIAPLSMLPPYIYPGPDDVDERVELMCGSVRRLAAYEPDCIALCTGSSEGYSREDARRIAIEGIREATRVADEHGTRIALEICRNDLGTDFTFLQEIPETMEFIEEVGSPAIGLCYDFYHLWDKDDALELTEQYATRTFGVQYNDWREPPRGPADRVLPGDGIMDIPGIIGALERGGFTGWYDFEVFSDDGRWGVDLPDSLWKMPYDEMLDKAHAGFRTAWEARR